MLFSLPLHPQIVHFPVVLILISLLFELVGRATDLEWWRKAALTLLVIAVVAGVAGILSGEAASHQAEELQRIPEDAVDAHGNLAKIAIWLACGALAARLVARAAGPVRAVVSSVALLLQLASAIAIGVAAHRGGSLVYTHAAGVSVNGKLLVHPDSSEAVVSGGH